MSPVIVSMYRFIQIQCTDYIYLLKLAVVLQVWLENHTTLPAFIRYNEIVIKYFNVCEYNSAESNLVHKIIKNQHQKTVF